MCNILSHDLEKHTATVEVHWFDLNLFIKKFDCWAGEALRENDLESAMMWAERSKEFQKVRKKLGDKTNIAKLIPQEK